MDTFDFEAMKDAQKHAMDGASEAAGGKLYPLNTSRYKNEESHFLSWEYMVDQVRGLVGVGAVSAGAAQYLLSEPDVIKQR